MAIKRFFRFSLSLSKCYSSAGLSLNLEFNNSATWITASKRSYSSVTHKAKARAWFDIVSDAERLLNYEALSFDSKSQEVNGNVQSTLLKLRSLVGSESPLLEIAKIFEPSSSAVETRQVRGLVVLLVAKLVGGHSRNLLHDISELDSFGLTPKQRLLSHITELIYSARIVHRTVLNIKHSVKTDDATSVVTQEEFNNKVAILIGDYLLARAGLHMGSLRNTKVIEMMSRIIRNFSEVEYMFRHDQQGKPYPTTTTTVRDWEVRSFLSFASNLANSCRSVLMLTSEDEVPQVQAFEFGKQLGMMWQIYDELLPFTQENHDSDFSLMSIPVILHVQRDPSLLDEILLHHNCLDGVDYQKIRSVIKNGTALEESVELQFKYALEAKRFLNQFGDSQCKNLLHEFVSHFSNH